MVIINKFRVRKWIKLHPENEILITKETYKRLGDIGLMKIIVIGSYEGKFITIDPEVIEIIPSSIDSISLSNLVRDVIKMYRESYLANEKKPTHYIF